MSGVRTLMAVTGYLRTPITRCAAVHPSLPTVFCTHEADHDGDHEHEYSERVWRAAPGGEGG